MTWEQIESFIVRQARGLRSEDGENPEYDRALVELTARLLGLTDDDLEQVKERILS